VVNRRARVARKQEASLPAKGTVVVQAIVRVHLGIHGSRKSDSLGIPSKLRVVPSLQRVHRDLSAAQVERVVSSSEVLAMLDDLCGQQRAKSSILSESAARLARVAVLLDQSNIG